MKSLRLRKEGCNSRGDGSSILDVYLPGTPSYCMTISWTFEEREGTLVWSWYHSQFQVFFFFTTSDPSRLDHHHRASPQYPIVLNSFTLSLQEKAVMKNFNFLPTFFCGSKDCNDTRRSGDPCRRLQKKLDLRKAQLG